MIPNSEYCKKRQKIVLTTTTSEGFYGTLDKDTPVNKDVIASLKSFETNYSKQFTYEGITTECGRVLYAYPEDLGELVSIKDQNGFEYLATGKPAFEMVPDIKINSADYNVYLLSSPVGLINFTFYFV